MSESLLPSANFTEPVTDRNSGTPIGKLSNNTVVVAAVKFLSTLQTSFDGDRHPVDCKTEMDTGKLSPCLKLLTLI